MAADKQLIVVVESSAALGYHWPTIVSDYLEKIVRRHMTLQYPCRSFVGSEMTEQKPSLSSASGTTFELSLVMFHTQGPYSGCGPQRSGWTRDVDTFLGWISSLTFSGGGLNDAAIAEGISEALMMFAIPQNGYPTQQNLDGKRHCILIAASNPYPLATPVYRPNIETLEHDEKMEGRAENLVYDAEAVAKWFGQCSISLSVICPKPLPKLKAIYNVPIGAVKRRYEFCGLRYSLSGVDFLLKVDSSCPSLLATLLSFLESRISNRLADCSRAFSVKLTKIVKHGKRNPRAADPSIEVKQPHFLVLISENFIEARAALSRAVLVPNQNPVPSLPTVSTPPTTLQPATILVKLLNKPSKVEPQVTVSTVRFILASTGFRLVVEHHG
ncbi:hypothetical protein Dimus_031163 [Dionaea muscipula]